MSYSVAFAPEALAQLDALEGYISESGTPLLAARFIDNIVSYCENLCVFPLRGARRDDLLPGLRITHYRRTTVIAFLVDTRAEAVLILGIFHGGQDYSTHMQPEAR